MRVLPGFAWGVCGGKRAVVNPKAATRGRSPLAASHTCAGRAVQQDAADVLDVQAAPDLGRQQAGRERAAQDRLDLAVEAADAQLQVCGREKKTGGVERV